MIGRIMIARTTPEVNSDRPLGEGGGWKNGRKARWSAIHTWAGWR